MDIALTVGLLVLLAVAGWVVAKVFRGGAPTGESSARADIYAADAGYATERMDDARNKQVK
jgi:hypothetical protein